MHLKTWLETTSVVCPPFTLGVIRTAVSNLDRETKDHYAVVIQAKDMAGSVGGLSGSTTVNINITDVNDNPPKFTQSEWLLFLTEFLSLLPYIQNLKQYMNSISFM